MSKIRAIAILLLLAGLGIGYFVYYTSTPAAQEKVSFFNKPFKLGLDLRGGSQLIYQADISKIEPASIGDAMSSLRTVIERRVNSLGLTEAVVRTEQTTLGEDQHRLVIEIPGVTDLNQAVSLINKTPSLEFKIVRPEGPEKEAIKNAIEEAQKLFGTSTISTSTLNQINPLAFEDPDFISSGLTGQYLKRATVQLGQSQGSVGPSIGIEFNDEGAKKFSEITRANIGKPLAIYLDGQIISAPTVQEEITNGQAQISGQFTLDEAKQLTRDLNLGALPVPIELVSTQTIGATLGQDALDRGIAAAIFAFAVIALFMIVWYRLPGLISVVSLAIYLSIMLALIKIIPITLTAGGIAGLILSLGIAVDANVLIFERLKEELRAGKKVRDAVLEGFGRAWTSIRDSNLSTIISSLILFWFGTAMIKGFAINLTIGVVVSMFTAITVTRTFLMALNAESSPLMRFLYSSGFSKGQQKNEK